MPAERNLQFNLVIKKVGGENLSRLVGDLRNIAKSMGAFSGALTGANKALNVANIDRIAGAIERLNVAFSGMGTGVGFKEAAQTLTGMSTAVGTLRAQYEQLLAVMNQVAAAQGKAALAAGRSEEENKIRRLTRTIERQQLVIKSTNERIRTLLAEARASLASGNADVQHARQLSSLATTLERARATGAAASQQLLDLVATNGKASTSAKNVTEAFKKEAEAEIGLTAQSKTLAKVIRDVATAQKEQQRMMRQAQASSMGLAKGFDKLIENQLRYLAGAALVFGTLNKLREGWESLVDLTWQSAKAFGVSRSAAMAAEERYSTLTGVIEDMTLRTGRGFKDVGEAVYQFGSAGLSVEETMRALRPTMDLIVATDSDVTRTVKTVAATFNMMGNQVAVAGDRLMGFKHIGDVMAATYRDNMVELQDLNQAMKFALPVAQQLNLRFEETTGILAFLHNNFIKAGEAGRSMRSIFQRMLSQPEEFQQAFGIAFDKTKPIDFMDILKQLHEQLGEGRLSAERLGTIFTRMGLRGSNAFILLSQRYDELQKVIGQLDTTAEGAAETMARARYDSLAGQIEILKQNMLDLIRTALGPTFAMFEAIVRALNNLAEALRASEFAPFLAAIAQVVGTLLALKVLLVALNLIWGLMAPRIFAAAAAMGIYTTSTIATTVATEGLVVANTAIGTSFLTFGGIIGSVGKLVTFLWTKLVALIPALGTLAAAAGPVGIAVAGLAAISAVAIAVYKLGKARAEESQWAGKSLLQLRNEANERQTQIDALEEHRKKLEKIRDEYASGVLSQYQLQAAMAATAKTFGFGREELRILGTSLTTVGNNVQQFINVLDRQKKALEDAREKLQQVRTDKVRTDLQKLRDSAAGYIDTVQRYPEMIKQFESMPFLMPGVEGMKGKLKEASAGLEKVRIDYAELMQANIELYPRIMDDARAMDVLLESVNAVGSELGRTADAAKVGREALTKMEVMHFSDNVKEVTRSIKSLNDSFEDLRLFSLFKLKIVVTDVDVAKWRQTLDAFKGEAKEGFVDAMRGLGNPQQLADLIQPFKDRLRREIPFEKITLINEESLDKAHDLEILSGYFNSILKQSLSLPAAQITQSLFSTEQVQRASKALNILEQRRLNTLQGAVNYTGREYKAKLELKKIQQEVNDQLRVEYANRVAVAKPGLEQAMVMNSYVAAQLRLNELLGDEKKWHEVMLVADLQREKASAESLVLASVYEKALRQASIVSFNQGRQILRNMSLASEQQKVISQNRKEIQDQIDAQIESSDTLQGLRKQEADSVVQETEARKTVAQQQASALEYVQKLLTAEWEVRKARQEMTNIGQTEVGQAWIALQDAKAQYVIQKDILRLAKERKYETDNIRLLEEQEAKIQKDGQSRAKRLAENLRAQQKAIFSNLKAYDLFASSQSKVVDLQYQQLDALFDLADVQEERVKREQDLAAAAIDQRVAEASIAEIKAKELAVTTKISEIEQQISDARFDNVKGISDQLTKLYRLQISAFEVAGATYDQARFEAQVAAETQNVYSAMTDVVSELTKLDILSKRLGTNLQYLPEHEMKLVAAINAGQEALLRTYDLRKKIVNETTQRQLNLEKGVLSALENQRMAVKTIADDLEGRLSDAVQLEIDQSPFNALLRYSGALKKDWTIIQRLGPQGIAEELAKALRKSSEPLKYMNGAMKDAASLLREINLEQRKLIEAQNKLKEAQIAAGRARFLGAVSRGDLESAQNALEAMTEAASQLQVVDFNEDLEKSIGYTTMLTEAAKILAEQYGRSPEEISAMESNLGSFKALLDSIAQTTKIVSESLRTATVSPETIASLRSVAEQLASIAGIGQGNLVAQIQATAAALPAGQMQAVAEQIAKTDAALSALPKLIDDVTQPLTKTVEQLTKFIDDLRNLKDIGTIQIEYQPHATQQMLKKQTGGIVPGVGKGDRVPMLLEPREYVIPGASVAAGGTAFFNRQRDPNFVRYLVQLLRANGVQGLATGGGGTGIPAVAGPAAGPGGQPRAVLDATAVREILDAAKVLGDRLVKDGMSAEDAGALETAVYEMVSRLSGKPSDPVFALSEADRARLDALWQKPEYNKFMTAIQELVAANVQARAEQRQALDQLQQTTDVPAERQQQLLAGPVENIRSIMADFAAKDKEAREEILRGIVLANEISRGGGVSPNLVANLAKMNEEQLTGFAAMAQASRDQVQKQDQLIQQISALIPMTQADAAQLRARNNEDLKAILDGLKAIPPAVAAENKAIATERVAAIEKPAAAGVPLQLQLTPTVDEIKVQLATLSPLVIKTDLDPEGARKAFEKLMEELRPQFEMTLTPKPVIGPPTGMQTGGWVPGTGSGDIVPAMLEPGEFVIPRKAVAALGPSFFEAIQSGGLTKDLQAIQRERQRGTISYGEYSNKIEDLRAEVQHFHGGGFVGGAIGYAGGGLTQPMRGMTSDPALQTLWNIEDKALSIDEALARMDKALDRPLMVKGIEETVKTESAKPKEDTKAAAAAAAAAGPAAAAAGPAAETAFTAVPPAARAMGQPGLLAAGAGVAGLGNPMMMSIMGILAQADPAVKNAERLALAEAKGLEQGKKWVANWHDLQQVLKDIGANELSDLKAGFDLFNQNVEAASGEIRKMAGDILEAFGAPFRSAIKAAGDLISDVFMNAIPQAFTFFVNDFIMALADVVKENQAAMKNIQKQYIDSRISLVEQLKRNEISYYDYFNRLEDLNADTQDNMAAAQDDAAARMEAVLSQFTQEFFNQFTSMLQDMTGGFFGFVQDLAGGVGDIATSFFDMFASVGGGIGQLAGMAIGGGIGAGVAGAATGGPGAVIGLAVGAVVGGVIGEVLKSVVPAVGAIFDAFMNVIDGITQGILSLIPVIVKFGTMGEDEFQALLTMLGGTGTDSLMGQIQTFVDNFGRRIDTIIPLLVQRIPELVSALVQAVRVAVPKINEALIALVPMIATTFAQAATELGPVIVTIFDAVAQAAGAAIQAMLETDMVGSFQTMFATIARSIAAVATDIAVPLIAAFMDVASAFIIGFANAIEANGPMLIGALSQVFVTFAMALPAVLTSPEVLNAVGSAAGAIIGAITNGLFEAIPGLAAFVGILTALGTLFASAYVAVGDLFIALQAILGAIGFVAVALYSIPFAPLLAILTAIGTVLVPVVGALVALGAALSWILFVKPLVTAFEYFGAIMERVMNQLQASPKAQAAIDKLMSALDRLGAAFSKLMAAVMGTEKNQDVVLAIADALVWLIEAALPLVDVLVWMVDVMTTLIDIGTKVVKFIDDLTGGFGIFAIIGAALAATLATLAAPILVLVAPIVAIGFAIWGLITILTDFAKKVERVFNFQPAIAAVTRFSRALTNVIAHAFAAVGRLAAGIYTVLVEPYVRGAQDLGSMFAWIGSQIAGLFIGLFELIASGWNTVWGAITANPIFQALMIGWNIFVLWVSSTLAPVFDGLIGAWTAVVTFISDVLSGAFDIPMAIMSQVVDFLNGAFADAFNLLAQALEWIDRILVGESVVPALEQFLLGLMFLDAVLKAVLKPVQDFVNALVNGVLAAFVAVYNFALILADFFVNGLWTAMNDLYNVGMNLFDLLYNNLWTAFNDLISVVKTLIETAGGIVPTPEDVGNAVEAGANTVADVATAAYNATLGQVFGKLHEGGVFNGAYATANMAPNEGIAILQRGEGVISTAGMRNLEQMSGATGAGALASIEAGRNPFFGGTAPYQAPYQAPAAGTFTGRQAGGGETVEETDIEVNVKFEGCSFSSEDTANKVEAEITKKLRNRQGNIYTEIRKVKKPKTSAGIRPR
jgi:TP901 family phage tail tape measure protein